jgi:hypothetical protein
MSQGPVKQDIRPATDGIFRRKFPCLEPVVIGKVMQGFEEVENYRTWRFGGRFMV